ncbi:MAG: hypothetical protein AAB442_00970 [Patescibacteria group bacterium]
MTFPHNRYRRGQVILLALVFATIFVTVSSAFVSYILAYGHSERANLAEAQALAIAEGALDHAAVMLNSNPSYTGETDTPLGNGTYTIAVTSIDTKTKRVVATAYIPNRSAPTNQKTISVHMGDIGNTISFHYGIQGGQGGFELYQSSTIIGNVFSSGSVIGVNGNVIEGEVISTGTSGLVYGIHATGTIYAHTIGHEDHATQADKDAYYVTKINTTVGGTSYPNSPDLEPVALPISDQQISEWESYAEAGGTIASCDGNGDYVISTSMSLGPKKIACNLVVKTTSGVLSVTGPLWITGNISTKTGPTIRIDPSLGNQNVAIIADNPADPAGSGIIDIGQNSVFLGSGSPNSFVFLISQNRSAEQGGSTVAMSMNQGSSALVAYASHGLIELKQTVDVKEATGYKIVMSNSAKVTYDSGLPSTLFQGGPGGSWGFLAGTYGTK